MYPAQPFGFGGQRRQSQPRPQMGPQPTPGGLQQRPTPLAGAPSPQLANLPGASRPSAYDPNSMASVVRPDMRQAPGPRQTASALPPTGTETGPARQTGFGRTGVDATGPAYDPTPRNTNVPGAGGRPTMRPMSAGSGKVDSGGNAWDDPVQRAAVENMPLTMDQTPGSQGSWNPWAQGPRQFDQGTQDWLRQNPQGGDFGGFRYQPQFSSYDGSLEGGNRPTGPLQQWNRIGLDQQGNPIGRDQEAFNPDGSYSHSWIESQGSWLDKNGYLVPLALMGATQPWGFGGSGTPGMDFGPEVWSGGGSAAGSGSGWGVGAGGVTTPFTGQIGWNTIGRGLTTAAGVANAAGEAQNPGVGGGGAGGTSNPAAAATQQQGENFRVNEYNLNANRPTVNSPIGSSSWRQVDDPTAPGGKRWVNDITMSDVERGIYDTRASNQGRSGQIASQMAGNIDTGAFSLNGFGQSQRVGGFQGPVATPQGERAMLAREGPQYSEVDLQRFGNEDFEMLGNSGSLERMDMSGARSPNFDRATGQGMPGARDLYGQQGYEGSRGRVEQAMFERANRLLEPQLQRAEAALDNQLRQQGLMPGSEGYNVAMEELRRTQGLQRQDIADQAILAGGQEQSRLAGIDLAADDQRFGQQQSIYGNRFRELGYNNDLTASESDRTWDRTMQGTEFNRASSQGDFNNLRTALSDRNATRMGRSNQGFDQMLRGTQANNQARGASFDDYMRGMDFTAGERQRVFGRDMDSLRTGYDIGFGLGGENRANAGFNNNVRQTDIGNARDVRNQNINEFLRMAGFGREAQMPGLAPFGNSNLQGADFQGAGRDQYGQQIDSRNYRNANYQQILNLLSNFFG